MEVLCITEQILETSTARWIFAKSADGENKHVQMSILAQVMRRLATL